MDLPWYRSWPAVEPEGIVPHVVDRLPRLRMSNYDYGTVTEWPDTEPGFCLLEWDVALDPHARRAFAAEALVNPREILAAPYRFHDTWCQWVGGDGAGPSPDARPAHEDDRRADYSGLGCIYLPKVILTEFLERPRHEPGGFSDATFGRWHHEHYGSVRLTWNIHPQHLHEYEG